MVGLASLVLLAAEITPERLAEVCGDDPAVECRWVLNWTDNRFLAQASDHVVGPAIQVIIIWVVAILVNKVVRFLIKRTGRRLEGAARSGRFARMKARTPKMLMDTGSVSIRSAARAKTITAVLRSVSSFIIYSVAILYTFSVLGLKLAPLLAGAGILGVALGFGAQTMVKDFLGGVFMLIEDQFGVGDVIDVADRVYGVDGVIGTVEGVTLRITSLRDVNGTVWHIPNGDIRRVGNMSQGWARALLDITVPFGTDLELARGLIIDVARKVTRSDAYRSEVMSEPQVWGVQELGVDTVVIRLVVKTRPGEQWPIARAMRREIHDALVATGIDPRLGQLDVFIREGPGVSGPSTRDGGVPEGVSEDSGEVIRSLDDLGSAGDRDRND